MNILRMLAMLTLASLLFVPIGFAEPCIGDYCCGDANGDGVVDISDIVFLNSWYSTPGAPTPFPGGNVDGCGLTTGADLLMMAWRSQLFDPVFEDCSITTPCPTTVVGSVKPGCRPFEIYPGGDSVAIPILVTTVAGVKGISLGFSYSLFYCNARITSVDFSVSEIPLLLSSSRCLPDEKKVAIAAALSGNTNIVYTNAVLCILNARIVSGDPLQLILLQPATVSPAGDWLFVRDQKPYYRPEFDQGYCCTSCGDADGDGADNISDVVYLISYIFSGGAAPGFCNYPFGKGDANGDGTVDISDVVYELLRIFVGDAQPHCMGG